MTWDYLNKQGNSLVENKYAKKSENSLTKRNDHIIAGAADGSDVSTFCGRNPDSGSSKHKHIFGKT